MLSRLLVRFLQRLAAYPMADAYDRIAAKIKGSFGLALQARVPPAEELELSAYNCRLLAALSSADEISGIRLEFAQVLGRTHPVIAPHADRVTNALDALKASPRDRVAAEVRIHDALFVASRHLFRALKEIWMLCARHPEVKHLVTEMSEMLPAGKREHVPTTALFTQATPEEVYLWVRLAEDFIAMRIATFIYHVLYQLRNLLTFALLGGLLLVLAVGAYPLQPSRFVTVFMWTLMLAVVIIGLTVIIRLERNEILSRLSASEPGRINFNLGFMRLVVVYVLLPLGAVVANIFPEVGDSLFSWVDGLQRLLP